MHIDKIRTQLDQTGIEMLYVTNPLNLQYALGFKLETESHLLLSNDGAAPVYFVGSLDFEYARDALGNAPVELVKIERGQKALELLAARIKELDLNGGELGYEDDFITVQKFRAMEKTLAGVTLDPAGHVVVQARMRKTPKEIDIITKACEITDEMFEHAFEIVRPGMKEFELAAELEYLGRRLGATKPAFETIVATGDRSWYPHGMSSEKVIQAGEIITIDQGVLYHGYCSDATRTRVVGGQASRDQAEIINLVNECQRQSVKQVRPGVTGKDVDAFTREFFKKLGVDQYFIHGTGHGVGIEVHEEPYISSIGDVELQEGMILTVEPGLYIPGKGGARTEDTLLVTKEGARSLSKFPIIDY